MAGIYKIENIITGYYYIGYSIDIFSRWSSHYTLIKTGKHSSPKLTDHWNSTEPTQWSFSILEYVSITKYKKVSNLKGKSLETSFRRHLLQREKYHMKMYSKNYALNKDDKHFS
jgi:hypothetical protein